MEIVIPLELLPVPKTLFDFTFALIGWQLGRSFSQFNGEVLELLKDKPFRLTIARVLHFFHHYWIGLLLIVLCQQLIFNWDAPFWTLQGALRALMWVGYGLFLEDSGYHVAAWVRTRLALPKRRVSYPRWVRLHLQDERQLNDVVKVAAKYGLCWQFESER